MKTNQYFTGLGLSLLLFAAGCGKQTETTTVNVSNEVIPVRIMQLNKSDFNNVIHASGQFTTNDETILSFKTGGVVSRILVSEGDQVKKGQLLATLDLTEISAMADQTRIGFEKATRDFNRAEKLYNDSVVTLEQLQNAKTAMEIARQQLATARFNLSYSEIRAAQPGVILMKLAREGQIAGPGTPVLQVSSKGQADWILRAALSDREWARTGLNDKAFVYIEALNSQHLEGLVTARSETADPVTGAFTVDIQVVNSRTLDIASGMFGKAEIFLSRKQRAWRIPYEALLDGNGRQGFVFVTNDGKMAMKVPVTIASVERNDVLISEGLEGYKSVITSGSAYLTDRSGIRVITNTHTSSLNYHENN